MNPLGKGQHCCGMHVNRSREGGAELEPNTMGWKTSVIASNETDNGGIKDAILEIQGEKTYDMLRWESGVHRVQRVPATEANGRVHTSTVAAVASLFQVHMAPYVEIYYVHRFFR